VAAERIRPRLRSRPGTVFATTLLAAALALPVAAQQQPGASGGEDALRHASQLVDVGRLVQAREVLEQLLAGEPAPAHDIRVSGLWMLYEVHRELGDAASFLPIVDDAVGQNEFDDPDISEMRVDARIDAGLVDQATELGRGWIEARPKEPRAYRSLADAEVAASRRQAAIDALRQGRGATEQPDLFAIELAHLYAEVDDADGIADEWAILLGANAGGLDTVVAHYTTMSGNPEPALHRTMEVAAASDRASPVRPGAMALALRIGEDQRAHTLAAATYGEEPIPADRASLERYAREAERAGYPLEVAWAAEALATIGRDASERRRWRAVSADMALQAHDTATASRAFRSLVGEGEPGSSAHRLATRRLFSLLAADASTVRDSERLLIVYNGLYPDSATVLAGMATELSRGYVRAGDREKARSVVATASETPPISESFEARSILDAQRALIALYDGDGESAAALLQGPASATGVDAEDRSRWIELLSAIESADSVDVAVFGATLGSGARDGAAADPDVASATLRSLPAEATSAGLYAVAAGELSVSGAERAAASVRRALVERFPGSSQAPAAMLELARAGMPGEEARSWLVRLVTGYPESAVAPMARRLLAELDGRLPGEER